MKRKPFLLYHWSPSERRAGIIKRGLVIGSKHATHSDGWRANYLCFSDSPSHAWGHSGGFKNQPGDWDLWMVWSNLIPDLKRLDHQDKTKPCEFRTRLSIKKRNIWYVGTRSHGPCK